jgi:hypothetical protein
MRYSSLTAALLMSLLFHFDLALGGDWRLEVAPQDRGWFVRSASIDAENRILIATWPEEEHDSGSQSPIWVVDVASGTRTQLAEDFKAWGVAWTAGGIWVLPRHGTEIQRFDSRGVRVESRALPVQATELVSAQSEVLIARMPIGGNSKLLWRGAPTRLLPWYGEVLRGKGDMASMMRQNTLLLGASDSLVVVARPFASSALEVLDRDGKRRYAFELPSLGPQKSDQDCRECGPSAYPVSGVAIGDAQIYCLVQTNELDLSGSGLQQLLVLDFDGRVLHRTAAPDQSASLLVDRDGRLLVLDNKLGVHALVAEFEDDR